jgi:hypothetical protein
VTCVHRWLLANLSTIGEGQGFHDCPIESTSAKAPSVLKLSIRIVASRGSRRGPLIRRYGPTDLPGSVEKALTTKLPKLARSPADVRILLLERSQMSLTEQEIWKEIQKRAHEFPLLTAITYVWFAETVFYDSTTDPEWRDALAFHRYSANGDLAESMEFFRGVLISTSRDGIPSVTPEARLVLPST